MWHPRTLFRLLRTLFHVFEGCVIVAFLFPWLDENKRLALRKRWSRQLLAMLGVRLRFMGDLRQASRELRELPRGLIVANHISFLDVYVINAVAPTTFVSKDDVRHWPIIGWLSESVGTLFLERGSRKAAQKACERIVDELRNGARVAIFPEGTTTTGDTVLPFHSALLQAAIDAETPVTPVVLRYRTANGLPSAAPAYIDDISLLQCLRSIADQKLLYAEISALPSLSPAQHDRRQLSAQAHKLISHALAQ